TILFGNDGGVFLTTNGSSPSPSFSFQSTDYNVTQFYSCAIHPSAQTDSFLAGAQDNGSHLFSSIGINSTTEVTGGDGAFVHIDQDDPSFMITSYTYNQYRKSTDGGSNFSYVNFSTSGKFINPTDYDNDSYKLFCSHDSGKYFVWTNPKTGSSGATVAFSTVSSGRVSAVFCDPNVSDRVYLGTDAGQIWRINNASSSPSPTQITGVGMSGYVSSIDVEDGDATHILVTYSNYGVSSVWESTDGGSTWTDIDGDLPDMPVRWGMFNPMGPDSVFLATELGVWTTDNINGASTSWGASNTGLANVRTDMLQWRESDSTLIAATHGRGLFSTSFTQVVEPQFIADKELIYQGTEVSFTDGSVGATSWAWDFDNDGNTDATDQNPSWTYNEGGNMTVKLTINGTKSITKTDYVQVIPRLGTPYTSADGGDFETNAWHFGSEAETGTNLWERGSPSNTLTTLNSSSNGWKTDLDANVPQETTKCFLYSPSFNLSESGTYTLSFRKSMQWYYNNAPYAVIVEYSTNGGGLWSKLGTSPDANGTNWYANTGISTLIESDGIGFLEGATNENTEYNISSLAGYSDVRFRFTYKSYQYFSLVGYVDGFMVDDFEISGPVNPPIFDIATEIASTSTESFGSGDSIAFKTADNKILAVVKNLGTHDYGSTTITIDGTGTSTQNFDTNTVAAKQIMNKTFTITPTTNNIAGSYQITTYFTEEEANAWKTNTGNFFKDLTQIKSPGSIGSATIANSVYGTNTIVDSTYDGHNLAITCTYSNGFSGFGAGLGGSGGALPVELISFEGYSYPTHNELKWETALELNSSHFTIEKRTEGEREFEAIGRVAAHGNSNIKHSYSFKDEDISSSTISYYRLKSVDYDGQYKHSQIVIIRPNEELIPIDIFPAPAKDFVKISTSSELESPLSITLRSLSGTVIKEIDYFIEKTTLDVSDITEGTYFITVSQGDRVIETRKIVVLK
ncbi:MAG: T9SS type A sorting domain-containing protein, partial [Bacteroidia bacterium]